MSSKRLIRQLQSNGWVVNRYNGSHCIMKKDGIRGIVTIPVHGSKDVSPLVIRNTERTTGLSLR